MFGEHNADDGVGGDGGGGGWRLLLRSLTNDDLHGALVGQGIGGDDDARKEREIRARVKVLPREGKVGQRWRQWGERPPLRSLARVDLSDGQVSEGEDGMG